MWGLAHLWVVGTMIAEAAPPFVVFERWGSLSRCNANHKPKAASPHDSSPGSGPPYERISDPQIPLTRL